MTQNGVNVSAVGGALTRAQAEQALGGRNAAYYNGMATHGLKGTVIPSSSGAEGGSLGFHVDDPRDIVVDPDIDGKNAVVLRPGTVQGSPVKKSEIAATGYDADAQLREQAHARLLQSVQDELEAEAEEARPRPAQVASPVPERQESRVSPVPEKPAGPSAPTRKIVFELGDQLGQFECYYHRIFQDGMYLVLVWDNRWQGARYTPPRGKKTSFGVLVGQERDVFTVYVGPKFTDPERDEDVLVLLIEEQRG